MYPPGQRPPPWFVPSDPNNPPQAIWQPPDGKSHDQWVTCHGMSCDTWKRTDEKMKRIIGSTNPILRDEYGTGSLVRKLYVNT